MNAEDSLKLARRFIGLPLEKRRLFLAALQKEGVDFAQFPIPAGVEVEDRQALSYAQRRMWFLWQLDPQSGAYNLPSAVRLKGRLDELALEQAFASLVERHEALRTVFRQLPDESLQQVPASAPLIVEREDFSILPEDERERRVRSEAQEQSMQPFDLAAGPLLRVKLIKLDAEQHVLLLTLHHIVSDGWSMSIIIDEFVRFYDAHRRGQALSLEPLPIQYADYALWQRRWMEAGEQERQLAYWQEQLGDEHPVLELPTDFPRPAVASHQGSRYEFDLPTALADELRQFARQQNVSLFTVLLAAFNILLYRYTGQTDLRVGVPIANRNRLEVEGLIGLFVNTQVIRARFDEQTLVAGLLQDLKEVVNAAQAHQDLPFERLVDALKLERSLSHTPLFQVMYNHQPEVADIETLQLSSGLSLSRLEWDSRTTQFDLTLDTYEKGGTLKAALTFASDLFVQATVERMAGHWLKVLNEIVADSARRVSELPVLDAAQVQAQVLEWNRTEAQFPAQRGVHQLFEEQVQRNPQAIALLFDQQALTYQQLNQRANRLAHKLRESAPAGAELLVGVATERSVEMVVALLAVLKAGGAYVPLDPEYPSERLRYMIEDSGVRLLLTQSHLLDNLPLGETVQALCLDQEGDWLEGYSDANPALPCLPEQLAYMIYTSGSTGRPKGAGNRHTALTNRLWWMQRAYSLDARDTVLQKTPFSFDVSVWEFFWPLMVGARLAVALPGEHREPARLIETIGRYQITTLHFVPSMLQAFIHEAGVEACGSLKRIICSGEALPVDAQQQVFSKLPGAGLFNLYGPTEAAIDVTHWRCVDERRASVPIGVPIDNLRTQILGSGLSLLPVGAGGELYLGGVGLARGYHQRPGLTAERFVPDPFNAGERLYRTGDLARYRVDGVIEYLGRLDHQVKLRGLRIELGEIEASLCDHELVREAVVLAQDGKQLVAYLVLTCEQPPADWREQLKASLLQGLPEYMVPQHLLALTVLPLMPNGKLDRKSLPRAEAGVQAEYVAPASDIEKALAAIWRDVLRVEQVGLEDNFFELGGDSIVSIQVVGRARQAGIAFSPRDLFQHQTVRSLAQVCQANVAVTIDQGPVSGEAPLTPVQQWFFEQPMTQRAHWNQSLLLTPRETLDLAHVDAAVLRLIEQHDGLRLRFEAGTQGWTQAHGAMPDASPVWQRQAATAEELNALCDEAQRSLSLAQGPLLRVLLVNMADGSQRLLLAIHHLVVDGVSWRVLLEDLQSLLTQARAGATLALPAKTSAYKVWAEQLQDYAQRPALARELDYWQAALADAPADLPCDHLQGGLSNALGQKVSVTFDAQLTRQLLQEVPAAYRTQVNDLLLTALARVIARWSGEQSVLIQLEGHGREELFEDIDLTRTLGWFTSLFPVKLTPAQDLAGSIKAVKEQLRAVPGKGLGFGVLRYLGEPQVQAILAELPAPRITFNYLGQFDAQFDDGALFVPATEKSGVAQDEQAPLANWLSIEGQVYGGELSLQWTFSSELHERATIERVAEDYRQELTALIGHCLQAEAGGATPSDFPLASLTQERLDALETPLVQIEDIYPLSPMQEGLLLHTLLEPNSGIYFMQDRYCIDSDIDLPRFRSAWQQVIQRHDALRASFNLDHQGEMLQIIHRHAPLRLDCLDWSEVPAEQHEADLQHLLENERQQGFNLLEQPPFSLRLIRRGPQQYWFILSNHHILIDAWCRSLLLQDFFTLYQGKQMPQPAARYRDFIAWLQEQGEEAAISAWREELQGVEQPTRLPYDRPMQRQGGQSQIGDRYLNLERSEGRALRELAQHYQLTVNTFTQAAWALVMHRYSGESDVVFGVTVAGRPISRPEMQDTVGLFINSIPLRVRMPQAGSVKQWLQALFEHNLALREHEHLPLVKIQACSHIDSSQQLFDSLFVFENAPLESAVVSGAQELSAIADSARTHTNYPLTVVVYPGDELGLHLSYDQRFFDEATIDRLLHDMKRVLGALVSGFHGQFSALSLLSDADRYQLVEACNQTERSYPLDQGYVRLFEASVAQYGERTAASCLDRQWSYNELNRQANRAGHGLIAAGVQIDQPVALLAERDLSLLGMIIGSFKAGAGYLPLDPHLPDERLLRLLELSRTPVLLCSAACAERARSLLASLAVEVAPRLLVWEDLQQGDAAQGNPQIYVGARHLAYAIYTSGSTGTPKGVLVEQGGMLNNQLSKLPYLELGEKDVIAQTASQSFDISVWQFLTAPLCGARVDIVPNDIAQEPAALLAHVRQAGITILESVPSLIQGLLDEPVMAFEHLRFMLPTGEAMPPELARRWLQRYPAIGLVNAYGPAECSDDVALYRVEMAATQGTCLPIGSPTDNNRLYLLDGQLQPVPVGAVGELWVAGVGVGRGYLSDPGRTAMAYLPDPFALEAGGRLYRTGDLGRRRNDGLLEYVGRVDHQVKVRGFRIELGEISAHLLELEVVRDAAVDVFESGTGKALVGYVVPASADLAHDALRDSLRDSLRQRLPDYMVPLQWVFLEGLPLTPNGKLDRKALPAPDAGQLQQCFVAPRNELEQRVAQIWQDVLKLERVGLTDNFFELGGHSLLATQVISRVRHALNIELALRTLFEHTTLHAFVQALGQSQAGGEPALVAVDRQQPLLLSYAQERQWFLWQLEPHSSAYNIPLALRLRGALDVAALTRSFNTLIERHESLRTRFIQDQQALQIIDAPLALALVAEPLASDALIAAAVQAEAQAPFDLQQGPLLRVKLLQLAADDHVLLLTQHHIISDGWSMQVLVEELIALYGAYSQGQSLELPALAIQYADYAQWQRQWMEAGELQRQLAYWSNQLGDEQPVLELPTDRPRPAVQDQRGARLEIPLDAALSAGLRQLAQREGATLFMVLLASFQALLHRYSGQSDIRVGVPVANRQRVDIERLIGFFVNTQVLKAEVDGQGAFIELLRQVKHTALQAQAHQDLPFEQLVQALQPERSLSHSPLFQVMYNHQSEGKRSIDVDLPGLRVEGLAWENQTAQFDLTLETYESRDSLSASVVYASALFDASTIERLAQHWQHLLQAVVADPTQRIAQLPLLATAHERVILEDWNRTAAAYPAGQCIQQLIEEQAARTPEAVALVFAGQQLSYAELNARANQWAHRLLELGVGPDVLVGVAVERSLEMVIGLLAVLKAGGAYVPLDPEYPQDRLSYMIEDSGLKLLLNQAHLALPIPAHVQALDLGQALSGYSSANPQVTLDPENLAYAIYTSGSTGKPKGVMVRHGALTNFIVSMAAAPGIGAQDRLLSLTTFSFDIFGLELYTPLMVGGRVVLASQDTQRDPELILQQVQAQGITLLQATPSTWRMLLESPNAGALAGRRFLCGGEALADELAVRMTALGAQTWNLYGPTETTIWSALQPLSSEHSHPYLGKAIHNTSLYILGEDLSANPVGVAGELLIGGDGLARGYFERPALTAERFLPNPYGEPGGRFYRTGDLARYRADGVIDYISRIDHQVKIRGFRIELGEIEARLLEHAEVREAVVVAQDGAQGPVLVSYLVAPEASEDTLREALKHSLHQQLPDYMVPQYWLFMERLPLTPNGKLDRKALPKPDASQVQKTYVAPSTERQRQVAQIWQDVLKLEQVGLADNFFELGGHSLLATQVMSRVRQLLNAEVPLRTLFEHSTLQAFVQALGEEQACSAPSLLPVPRDQVLHLSYAQERQWFLWQLEPQSVAYNLPLALRLQGHLDVLALERSFNNLIARHEILRTGFAQNDLQVLPVIHAQAGLQLEVQALDNVDGLDAAVDAEAHRPFDLKHDALLRVKLLRLGADEHVLILTQHHIVSDAWSMQVMVDELVETYAAYSQGQAPSLPALPLQYLDYAQWQRQWMEDGEQARQLAYWTDKLGGEQPVLALPTDYPRPSVQSFAGASQVVTLPTSLLHSLKALAQREQVTLFMLLLASFQTLLHRYSGQNDIRVGVPIANRNRVEIERLIGFFVNTQVLKAEVDGQGTFSELLDQVKQTALQAQAHQDLPFEQLVQALQPERSLSHSPLFQVMYNHLGEGRKGVDIALPGLSLSGLEARGRTTQFDLNLETYEAHEQLVATLTYAVDLFTPHSMAQLLGHWQNLLHAIVADPTQRVGVLPLLAEAQAQQVLLGWNQTQAEYPLHLGVHQLIEAQVERTPEAIALVFGDTQLSYAQLDARANQWAQRLSGLGVGTDVLVGVAAERSLEMVIGLLAVLKAGGAYVPLDPEYPQERLSYMMQDSGIGLLLTQAHLREQLPIPQGVQLLDLGESVATFSTERLQRELDPQSLAYVIYTSGSTGQPKGAGNRHAALTNRLCWMQEAYALDATDAVLQKTPFSFDVSVWEFFWPLMTGARLVVAEPGAHRDPGALVELINQHAVTTLHFVPSMLQAFLLDARAASCAGLRQVICSGEALPVEAQQQVFKQLPQTRLYNLYGPTEAAIDVTHWQCVDEGRDSVPIGQPIANLGTYILGPELEPLPVGVAGELYLGGEGLARGYHRRPALTAERFVPNPYGTGRLYRTGDLARHRASGVIEYLGRIDHQVKIRGLRIELGEIEARLMEQPSVVEAVVIAQDGPTGKRLVAYVVPGDAQRLQGSEQDQSRYGAALGASLSRNLPDYMVPGQWIVLERMPLSPNGKLDRKALPKADPVLAQQVYQAPETEIEQQIAEIWQGILHIERIGLGDNFFDLGGHSLLATQAVSRINSQLGIDIALRLIFETPTLAEFAQAVLESRSALSEEGLSDIEKMMDLMEEA
ncbi:non-ribosomal peptide synthase/polyketide synthase [Pseudomonas brenneri]|uniref:non-ribosomal peptide synthase/polyketide synthase n=4 Tax=Pseudomonas fluorescens group TaxID=136843 RepID=UPI0025A16DB0|nr:non-ribosomal peptide synthase/polyketide synthase [Pseudomonas brenneri]WJM89444.1 non-ribosomal peptide synthase/polyketide synthase [Pseudomonas brenneri]